MDFENKLLTTLKKQVGKEINLEVIENQEFGDFALPCFQLAKELKKNPNQIAEDLSKSLKLPKFIERAEIKGPYLNFFLNQKILAKTTIKEVLEEKKKYGHSPKNKKKILLEHTSVNPSGPLNVGRIRGSFIGDCLKRTYISQGYNIKTHYYVNDIGRQIAILAWAKENKVKTSKELEEKFKAYIKNPDFETLFLYVEANKSAEDPKNSEAISTMLQKCELGSKTHINKLKKAANHCLKGQIKSLERLGIEFDSFDSESQFIEDNSVEKITKKLKELKEYIDLEGAKALDLSEYGLKRRSGGLVFQRKDKTSVYISRDLAYHQWKLKKSDHLINVLGEDHKVEAQELKQILKLMNLTKTKKIENVFLSFVGLKSGRLSTRKGETIPIDSFLDEGITRAKKLILERHNALSRRELHNIAQKIAAGAIRYAELKVAPLKQIMFDWEEALAFEGETGPYLQYALVRASKILEKAQKTNKEAKLELLASKEEKALIKEISNLKKTLSNTIKTNSPHILAKYIYSLATKFNKFYEHQKVLGEEKSLESARIALVKAFCQTMENSLTILGIDPISLM
jgi:arginyl-tRNA synthetase